MACSAVNRQGKAVAAASEDGEPLLQLAQRVLDVAFQPIVDADSGRLAAWESLMRNHEKLGFATPPDLLDFAYASGSLDMLESLLSRKALAKFLAQPQRGGMLLFLNFDSRLIGQGEELFSRLLKLLNETGLSPTFFCFEISERFDITGTPNLGRLMERMRHAGFRFAIDDFGAGTGEMKLLCDYSVDYVKIDRYFISGIDNSPRRRHIVSNLVATAHRLGARVVAEGVETEGESVTCRDLGVDFLQGWFIGRPEIEVSTPSQAFSPPRRNGVVGVSTSGGDRDLILGRVEFPQPVYEDDGIERAFEIFRSQPGFAYLPVLAANGAPRGIIKEERLKEFIYQPFGRDLLQNRIYNRRIAHFTDRAPVVAVDTTTETMLGVFAGVEESPCLILTDNGAYAGAVSASSLLRVMHEKNVRAAQDQNPLTGLPGNLAIGEYLATTACETEMVRHFCYFDFDHFKPFNDLYGFQKGDHAITLFSALMRRYFFAEDAFLGHVGGDDFFIGIKGVTREDLLDMLRRLVEDFREEVAALYTEEARAAGFVRGRDRNGEERSYSLMRCSVGVLELPAGMRPAHAEDLAADITTLKASAKKSDTGICLLEAD